jgi:hypothetical protein
MFTPFLLVATLANAKPSTPPVKAQTKIASPAYTPRSCKGMLEVTGLAGKSVPPDEVRHATTQLFEAALMTHGDVSKAPTLRDIAESFADVWYGCLNISVR